MARKQPTDGMLQCPACHGQAPDFRCSYCEGAGGVTEGRFHAYHDRAMGRVRTRQNGPDIAHADLCMLSRIFHEKDFPISLDASVRINEWLKAQIAAAREG